jgi:hypothetical protein
VKIVAKILLCLLINLLVIKGLYLSTIEKSTGKNILIRQVYSKPGFKYWTAIDGKEVCKSMNPDETTAFDNSLNQFADTKTNVIYFQNTNLLDCIDHISTLAALYHKHGLEIAFNLEAEFEEDKVFPLNHASFDSNYYSTKFAKAVFASDWVDYLVFDNGMKSLTFDERRSVQSVLREVFKKPFLGFRFVSDGYDLNPEANHPVREDIKMREFLPRDDDGDFMITNFKPQSLKRTMLFVESTVSDRIGVDGEFSK